MKKEKIHEFEIHIQSCEKCASVDMDKTSSMANCCAKGAPLLMDFISEKQTAIAKKMQKALKHQFLQMEDRKVYKTTSSKVKMITRYK